ncbi:MAG: beta-ketoacyl synthase N-terminal-like domain-containing protein [Pirellula sp.]
MRRRVVVTGLGAINPLGHDVSTMWKALLESQSRVGPMRGGLRRSR